jgi:hypothetical protein
MAVAAVEVTDQPTATMSAMVVIATTMMTRMNTKMVMAQVLGKPMLVKPKLVLNPPLTPQPPLTTA